MKSVNTRDLVGAALDWAVTMCEGLEPTITEGRRIWIGSKRPFDPSISWADAGPIIAREAIGIRRHAGSHLWFAMRSADMGNGQTVDWAEHTVSGGMRYGGHSYQVHKRQQRFDGHTALIAAMRCWVGTKLGPTVEVPAVLI